MGEWGEENCGLGKNIAGGDEGIRKSAEIEGPETQPRKTPPHIDSKLK